MHNLPEQAESIAKNQLDFNALCNSSPGIPVFLDFLVLLPPCRPSSLKLQPSVGLVETIFPFSLFPILC